MKNVRTIKSAVSIAVLGSFLAACSGGGTDSKATTLMPAKPTTGSNTSSVPPTVNANPVSIGTSNDAAISDISMDTRALREELAAARKDISDTKGNTKDIKSKSKTTQYLAIGAVSALGLMMLNNGYKSYKANGSIWKGLGGFAFNDGSEAERKVASDLADEKLKQYEDTAGYYDERSNARAGTMLAAGMKGTADVAAAVGNRLDKTDKRYEEGTGKITGAIAALPDPTPRLAAMQTDIKNYTEGMSRLQVQNAALALEAGKLAATKDALATAQGERTKAQSELIVAVTGAQTVDAQNKALKDKQRQLVSSVDSLLNDVEKIKHGSDRTTNEELVDLKSSVNDLRNLLK